MKKIITLSLLLATLFSFGQVPQGISYQAIAMNTAGNPVTSSNVRLRISVLDASTTGTTLYSETHLKTTNAQGLFNLTIGQGTVLSGVFNTINWATNSKFLKVEMDATGGTTFVNVGTTQLLAVPYALAADSLITSPGEGITLLSPNGTPFVVSVNDAGQLSLPTSGTTGTTPNQLYAYGTFNNFNAATALLFGIASQSFMGYKYLTSGSQLKFLAGNNSSATVYGLNASQELVTSGAAYTVPSNGFYFINIYFDSNNPMYFSASQFAPTLIIQNNGTSINPSYNATNNTFTFTINGMTTVNRFKFDIPHPNGSSSAGAFGDFLGDGSIDFNGPEITFPGVSSTPKNYRVELIINFNGSGSYTITQI